MRKGKLDNGDQLTVSVKWEKKGREEEELEEVRGMKKHNYQLLSIFKTPSTTTPQYPPQFFYLQLVFLIFQVSLIKTVEFTFTHTPLALAFDNDIDWKILCCQFFQYHWHNGLQAQVIYPSSLLYIKSNGLEDEF